MISGVLSRFCQALPLLLCCVGFSLSSLQAQSTWRVLADARPNNAVWMLSATEGWAVGDLGLISHTTDGGVSWTEQDSGTTANLNGIWGSSGSNIWAVGDGGVIVNFNGTSWAAQASKVTVNLAAVHGIDASNVWVAGANVTILQWDGTNWNSATTPTPRNVNLDGIFALNGTHVWAVGGGGRVIFWNGTTWQNQISGTNDDLFGVWASSATAILAVGEAGTVRFSNDSATWAAGPGNSGTNTLRAISGTDASHVWIVGDGGTTRFFDGSGNFVNQNSNTGQALNGVFAATNTAVFSVGARKTFDRFNGTTWSAQTAPTPLTNFNASWGTDDGNVWFAGGGGVIMRYNGAAFTLTASGVNANLTDIWGADSNNIWAVGANGVILKWNGTVWAPQTSGVTVALTAVHGTSPTNVWAVGFGGTILHFNGTSWSPQASGTTENLLSVWAASASAAWAVGTRGVILRYGTSWAAQTSGVTQSLTSVAGSGASAVWASGNNGTILKYSGSSWALQAGGTSANLNALAVINSTNQWTAGGTTILRGNGAAWAADGLTGYGAAINGAWASSINTVFLAAGNGMIFTNAPLVFPEISVEQPAATVLHSGENTIDLGSAVTPGNTSRTFTLRSTGTADITGLAITKTGAHAGDFSISALASPTLTMGTSTTFDVTFTPSADGVRTATLNIASNDLDEPLFTISLTGLGQVPASFSTQPISKSVNPNANATFTCVVATGVTKPFTYLWQKFNTDTMAWDNIIGATAASYTVIKAQEANEGDYRCLVTNPVSAVPTNTVTLGVNEPIAITLHPVPTTAGTGDTVTFIVAATGSDSKKYVWRRNGAAIPGAPDLPTYTINGALVTHAGDYSVVVSNAVNSVTSGIANLTVIDDDAKTVKASAGTKATLTASFSGKPTAFLWKKAGGALPADFRYTFVKNVLSIASCQIAPTDDSAMFTCDITGPDGAVVTSTLNLVVYTGPPEITGVEPLAMPDAMIGDPTYQHQIPFDADLLKSPVSFTATGLPTGLTCNKDTGIIRGNPAVALAADKTYSVTFTATNARGKSVKKANLLLKSLPAASVGVFAGPVERNATLNGGLGGRFELTSTTKGSFTGKVVLGKTSYSISGLVTSDVDGATAPRASATIKRTAPLVNLTVSFEFDLPNHALKNCEITDGSIHFAFTAWRRRWGTAMSLADSDDLKTYLGYYTFGIDPPVPVVAPPTTAAEVQPQGMGYGSFTILTSGSLTIAGKLPDGTAYTFGTFCGPHGEVFVFQALYTNLGSLLGSLDITQGTAGFTPPYGDNTLSGILSHLRPQMLGTNHVYRAGFGPIDGTVVGGRFVPPLKPALLFGVVDDGVANNARVTFTDGGLTGTSTDVLGTQTLPNVDVRIKSTGVYVPPHSTTIVPDPNPRSTTLTLTSTTGLFSGKSTLIDPNPAKPGFNITRTLSYYGIIFRDTDSQFRGYGYFLLARRPDLATQTALTTDQLSGQVVLEKK